MSNPTFKTGPITHTVAEPVDKYHVVTLTAGGVTHCDATDTPYGAVAASGTPETPRQDNVLRAGLPSVVAVHSAGVALPLVIASTSAEVAVGATVYAAAGGEVSTTGTQVVGVAIRKPAPKGDRNTVVVLLSCDGTTKGA